MIIITGGNGQLGRAVVERLLARVPAERIGVSVRDPEKARGLAERGIRVRRGDFGDAASLAHSFEGAEKVLIVSTDIVGEKALAAQGTAIEAAKEAGARRLFYTSHMGSNPASPFPPMPDHAATEAMLAASGVPYTSLRNGFYASSAVRFLGDAVRTGVLAAPADGPVSWTAHADLAEAAAIALAAEAIGPGEDASPHTPGADAPRLPETSAAALAGWPASGPTPPLTGARSLDMAGIAAIAADLTGRSITRVTVADEDYREGLLAHGVPEQAADLLLGFYQAARKGEFAETTPDLARLTGRPTVSAREVLAAALAARG